jgi:hypothetical protein
VRDRRFLIIDIGPNISDMRIRQTDNLARITRIGENFLVTSEARIENDFAAAPGDRSPAAAVKNAPVFERQNSLPCFCFRQWTLSLQPKKRLYTFAKALRGALAKANYFTDSARTGIEPK